jgi:hypothetical protein
VILVLYSQGRVPGVLLTGGQVGTRAGLDMIVNPTIIKPLYKYYAGHCPLPEVYLI